MALPPKTATQSDHQPWWRERFMWMVVGGPLAVVVAGFVTLALAILNPDPIITTTAKPGQPDAPAMQARNHSASPTR
jgi:hypothetical protein